jgi:hypothetical protein
MGLGGGEASGKVTIGVPTLKSVGGIHLRHQKTNATIGLWFMVG